MIKNAYQIDSLLTLFFNAKTTLGTFASKSILAIFWRIFSIAIRFALQAFLVRSMGLAVYGEYVYVLAWITSLADIGTLGMDKVVLRFAAEYHVQKEHALLARIWRSSSLVACLVGLLFGGTLAGVVWFLGTSMASSQRICFLVASPLIPLMALTNISESCLRALGHIVQGLSSLLVIPTVLGLLTLLILVDSSSNLSSVMVMSAHLAAVFAALTLVLWFCRSTKHEHPRVRLQGNGSREWVAMTLPMFFLTLQNVAQAQCGVLLSGSLLGTSQAGVYSLMVQITAFMGFGLQTINLVAAPMFAKLHASGKKKQLQNLARACACVSTLFCLGAAAGLMLFWDSIEQLFGTALEEGQVCLGILAIGAIINATAGSVGYLLLMSGNHTICVKVLSLGALLNLLLSAVLIPRYGIVGAAIAQTVTTATWNAALVYYVHKRMDIWSPLGRFSLSAG